MKKTLITTYYMLLVALISWQAFSTIYKGSQSVGFGQRLQSLETQQANLKKELHTLEQKKAETVSLVAVNEYLESTEHQPITKTIKVETNNPVALR